MQYHKHKGCTSFTFAHSWKSWQDSIRHHCQQFDHCHLYHRLSLGPSNSNAVSRKVRKLQPSPQTLHQRTTIGKKNKKSGQGGSSQRYLPENCRFDLTSSFLSLSPLEIQFRKFGVVCKALKAELVRRSSTDPLSRSSNKYEIIFLQI